MNNAEHPRLDDYRVDQLLEKLEIPGLLRDKSEEEIRSQFAAAGFRESIGDDVLTHVSVVRTPDNTVIEVRMGDHSVYSMRRIVDNADKPTWGELTELRKAIAQIGESGYRVPYAPLKVTAPDELLQRAKARIWSLFGKKEK